MEEYIVGTDGHEGNWLTGERIIRCRDCKHYREVSYVDGKRTFPDDTQEAQYHLCELERITGEAWRPERTCKLDQELIHPSIIDMVMEYTCSACGKEAYNQVLEEGDMLRYCPNCGAKVVE